MATTLDHLLEQMTAKRRAAIKARADELAKLKDLRQAVAQGIGPWLSHANN